MDAQAPYATARGFRKAFETRIEDLRAGVHFSVTRFSQRSLIFAFLLTEDSVVQRTQYDLSHIGSSRRC